MPQLGAWGNRFATDGETSRGASSAILLNRDLEVVNSAWLDDDLKEKSEKPDDGKDWDQFDAYYKLTGRRATCVGVTFQKSLRKLYP